MSEKRGQTEKLRYDFNTARAVFVKNVKGGYSRITERDFRSYNGERYILINSEYQSYDGPIYYWNTNKICKEPIGENKIQYAHDIPWVSIRRPHERYLED
jgi:uncharacterized secreted protein with C-terminal beta-propeller domain